LTIVGGGLSMSRRAGLCIVALALVAATACASAYYKAMETFGYEKRDILVGRIEGTQEAQQDAETRFTDALEQFQAVIGASGGELERAYDKLSAEYERSEAAAATVRERIGEVKQVANDLFVEWTDELDEYSSDKLRRKSQQQLQGTQQRYGELIGKLDAAAERMDPVLATLHDQVLFLKHNLNAQALGSLEQTAADLEHEVDLLIRDMREATAEADRFLATLGAGASGKKS
jgi:hypothetical protein